METVMEERTKSARGRAYRIRTITYWIATLIIADEMIAGSIWDLLHIEYVRVILTHLGYPLYLLNILGAWKLPCGVVLLVPWFARLKEWAYAGAFFTYTGAAASHLTIGDSITVWAGPAVFAGITLASWALRPSDRRLVPPPPDIGTRPIAWVVPVVVAAAMLGLAFLTLPKGVSGLSPVW